MSDTTLCNTCHSRMLPGSNGLCPSCGASPFAVPTAMSRSAAGIHPGARALVIALLWLAAAIVLGSLTAYSAQGDETSRHILRTVMIGFPAVICVLAAPAWLILSARDIFAWVLLRFGLKALIVVVAVLTVVGTVLSAWVFIVSDQAHRFHVHATVALWVSTGALYMLLVKLLVVECSSATTSTQERDEDL